MVVLTIVTQKNGDTIYFDSPLPKVHFMKLLSCSLYNSFDTIKGGSAGLDDRNLNPSGAVSKLTAGHYDLDSLAKKIRELFSNQRYSQFETEQNTPLGQLVVINNFGAKQIKLDKNLAKLFGTGQDLPLKTVIKRVITTTAYFIHCDLIDKNNILFNRKRSDLLAKFDITGKPYEKVMYDKSCNFLIETARQILM